MKHSVSQLLDDILSVLQTIREDKTKLEKLHDFVMEEIYEEPEEPKIPEKFQKMVSGIADSLTAGFVCFVNPDTLEVEEIPQHALEEPEDYEAMTGESTDDFRLKHQKWKKCIEIEPPESYDSFKIMERFVEKVPDANLREKLIDALSRKRPFANFKSIVDNSDFRQDWFDFRKKQLEQYVYEILENEMEQLTDI